jgi:hypothetical protein
VAHVVLDSDDPELARRRLLHHATHRWRDGTSASIAARRTLSPRRCGRRAVGHCAGRIARGS